MRSIRTIASAAIIAAATLGPVATAWALEEPDPGSYTTANLPASNPFAGLPVSVSTLGWDAFRALEAQLTTAQSEDLNERCAVVASNPGIYGQAAAGFCGNLQVAQGIAVDDDDLP